VDVLLWLIPIPVAAIAAVAWGAWSSRTRRPDEAYDTVAAHDRFRAALAAPPRPTAAQNPKPSMPSSPSTPPVAAPPSSTGEDLRSE
jgi:hypothetical protein